MSCEQLGGCHVVKVGHDDTIDLLQQSVADFGEIAHGFWMVRARIPGARELTDILEAAPVVRGFIARWMLLELLSRDAFVNWLSPFRFDLRQLLLQSAEPIFGCLVGSTAHDHASDVIRLLGYLSFQFSTPVIEVLLHALQR